MGAPGYDDAPLAKLADGEPKSITIVLPFYNNKDFLAFQLGVWGAYSPEVLKHWRAIIVVDCSPGVPAEAVVSTLTLPFPIRLFRIDVDRRWNWLAARNIGMHHAAPGWCITTDMDHVVDAAVARNLVHQAHDPKVIYRFSRREHTGEKIRPHPNSQLMTRKMFWKVGGYDERMSGYYGSDGYYRRRCAAAAPVRTLPDELVRFEFQGDSSTAGYKRKQPEDAELRKIIRAFPTGSKPTHLTFPYHEVLL